MDISACVVLVGVKRSAWVNAKARGLPKEDEERGACTGREGLEWTSDNCGTVFLLYTL